MIGRAGVLSSGVRKKRGDNNPLRAYYEEISQNPQKVIKSAKYPFAIWFMALFCLGIGIAMIWHIAFNVPETLFSGFRRGTWWQYMISISITVLGVLFLFAGKRSSLEINREKDLIKIKKTNICCRNHIETRKMSECLNVQIIKKGIESPANKTAHFKLMLYFAVGRALCAYETGDKHKIKKKYIDVANYIGFEVNVDQMHIVDLSINPHADNPPNRV